MGQPLSDRKFFIGLFVVVMVWMLTVIAGEMLPPMNPLFVKLMGGF